MTGPVVEASAPVLLPVALRLDGRACLVVGGGEVAVSKARALLACGARVTVVASAVGPSMSALAAEVPGPEVRERSYEPGDLVGKALVVTATGVAEVDAAVFADARATGTLVNAADDPSHCDVYLTSVHRAGPVSVSVSTAGTSPALARFLRRRLAEQVGPEFGALALLLAECRRNLRAQGRSTESLDWDALLGDELVATVRRGELDAARAAIEAWAAS